MCGIAAILSPDRASRETSMRRMLDALAHRGPDGEGLHHDALVTLGHRRLSIIDLEGAAQEPRRRDTPRRERRDLQLSRIEKGPGAARIQLSYEQRLRAHHRALRAL